jgi:peptidoglycan/xylan/chitin deacetylase (PgdA/CDA1 family)
MFVASSRRLARMLVRRWSRSISVTDAPWSTLCRELDCWRGAPAVFWWRDDDAVAATPALARLLGLRAQLGLPLALAVIPAHAQQSLPEAVEPHAGVRILVHGGDHRNRSGNDRHPSELCAGRSPREVRDQLRAGRERLAGLFAMRALPVLVPPFNRLSATLCGALQDAGLRHVSLDQDFTPCPLPSRNVHVNVINWRNRSAVSAADAIGPLVAALRLRRYGLVARSEPLGIMTHHLDHDEAAWALTAELLHRLATHGAGHFPAIASIFADPTADRPR